MKKLDRNINLFFFTGIHKLLLYLSYVDKKKYKLYSQDFEDAIKVQFRQDINVIQENLNYSEFSKLYNKPTDAIEAIIEQTDTKNKPEPEENQEEDTKEDEEKSQGRRNTRRRGKKSGRRNTRRRGKK